MGTKDEEEMPRGFFSEQPHLLSKSQADIVVDRINAAVDIPLLTESMERKLIAGIVGMLNPLLKDALASCLSINMLEAVTVLLDETKPRDEKGDLIRGSLDRAVQEPLVTFLHGKIDMTVIPDALEKKVLK